MPDYREVAKKYIKQGYSVLPVNETKNPSIAKWGVFQTRQMTEQEIERHFKDCWGVGFICGKISSCVALDFDTKYFIDKNLYDKIKEEIPSSILKKMYVQTTKNGGYHWIFKVNKNLIKGNQKLANRPTTPEEKDEVYREAYKNAKTRHKALKMAQNHKCVVLVETREDGGYVLISPTKGYERVYGKIQEISQEEYEVLMSTIRSFNEYAPEETRTKMYNSDEWETNPFEDYNQNGDVLNVLLESGWEIIYEGKTNVRLKRAGQVHSASSALLDKDTNVLNVFSTSTSFEVGKGHSASFIFTELECDGDFSLAFKKLIDLGYGTKK